MPSPPPARRARGEIVALLRAAVRAGRTVRLANSAAGFRAGRSIAHLARAHNRTELAVEAQLERMGLWDRVQRRSTGPASKLNFQAPADWPAAPEPNV